MGGAAGVCGVFGILLDDRFEELENEMLAEARAMIDDYETEFNVVYDVVEDPDFLHRWLPVIVEHFRELGIEIPEGAYLAWSGDRQERPARCETPAECFIVGFGFLLPPWEWQEKLGVDKWPESFRKAARLHTWVWMG